MATCGPAGITGKQPRPDLRRRAHRLARDLALYGHNDITLEAADDDGTNLVIAIAIGSTTKQRAAERLAK